MPHRSAIDLGEQRLDRRIELADAEEAPVAKRGEYTAFHDLHRNLNLALVPGLRWPRWDHRNLVVLREPRVRPVHIRVVQARVGDTSLRIVRHDDLRHGPKVLQGSDMC